MRWMPTVRAMAVGAAVFLVVVVGVILAAIGIAGPGSQAAFAQIVTSTTEEPPTTVTAPTTTAPRPPPTTATTAPSTTVSSPSTTAGRSSTTATTVDDSPATTAVRKEIPAPSGPTVTTPPAIVVAPGSGNMAWWLIALSPLGFGAAGAVLAVNWFRNRGGAA